MANIDKTLLYYITKNHFDSFKMILDKYDVGLKLENYSNFEDSWDSYDEDDEAKGDYFLLPVDLGLDILCTPSKKRFANYLYKRFCNKLEFTNLVVGAMEELVIQDFAKLQSVIQSWDWFGEWYPRYDNHFGILRFYLNHKEFIRLDSLLKNVIIQHPFICKSKIGKTNVWNQILNKIVNECIERVQYLAKIFNLMDSEQLAGVIEFAFCQQMKQNPSFIIVQVFETLLQVLIDKPLNYYNLFVEVLKTQNCRVLVLLNEINGQKCATEICKYIEKCNAYNTKYRWNWRIEPNLEFISTLYWLALKYDTRIKELVKDFFQSASKSCLINENKTHVFSKPFAPYARKWVEECYENAIANKRFENALRIYVDLMGEKTANFFNIHDIEKNIAPFVYRETLQDLHDYIKDSHCKTLIPRINLLQYYILNPINKRRGMGGLMQLVSYGAQDIYLCQ